MKKNYLQNSDLTEYPVQEINRIRNLIYMEWALDGVLRQQTVHHSALNYQMCRKQFRRLTVLMEQGKLPYGPSEYKTKT